jgi:hypothetical protein
MSQFRIVLTTVIAVAALLVAVSSATAQGSEEPSVTCAPFTEFDAGNFGDSSTTIDNKLLPLTPGTRRVYEGVANRGGGSNEHSVTFTVTDVTKVIDGVRSVAVWDVDRQEGELVEEELAFFAQDDDGNVWNLGEYPEEFEGGVFSGAPNTWFSGIDDAIAGVHMPADPEVGTPEYLQGSSPSIDFLDCATVAEDDGSLCVPVGCFHDVVTTHERSPLEPASGLQTKAHAEGVGIVQIGAIGDPEGETLNLTEFTKLDQAECLEARDAALRLDARGFQNSEVYAQTEPAEAPSTDECPGRVNDEGDDDDHPGGDDHGGPPEDGGGVPVDDDHGQVDDHPKGDDNHDGDEGEHRHKGGDDRHRGDGGRHEGRGGRDHDDD